MESAKVIFAQNKDAESENQLIKTIKSITINFIQEIQSNNK